MASTKLDPAAPMRSLREAAGLTQEAMAAARGVAQPNVSRAEASGDGVRLRDLAEVAAAVGLALEIRVRDA
jgi:transcriptional regulator with XRE-family HTH domain